jgi:hypothetical protein
MSFARKKYPSCNPGPRAFHTSIHQTAKPFLMFVLGLVSASPDLAHSALCLVFFFLYTALAFSFFLSGVFQHMTSVRDTRIPFFNPVSQGRDVERDCYTRKVGQTCSMGRLQRHTQAAEKSRHSLAGGETEEETAYICNNYNTHTVAIQTHSCATPILLFSAPVVSK